MGSLKYLILIFLFFLGCKENSIYDYIDSFNSNLLGQYQGRVLLQTHDSLGNYLESYIYGTIATLSNNENQVYVNFPKKGLILEVYRDSVNLNNLISKAINPIEYNLSSNYYIHFNKDNKPIEISMLQFVLLKRTDTISIGWSYKINNTTYCYDFLGKKLINR